MKKILLLTMLTILSIAVKAQGPPTGRGTLTVINNTDCDVVYNVYKICPGAQPCVEYSANFFKLLSARTPGTPPTPTQDFFAFRPAPNATESEYGVMTGCPTTWTWAYATVSMQFPCDGNGYTDVGYRSCTVSSMSSTVPLCVCNGQQVYVDFVIISPSGNCVITIHY